MEFISVKEASKKWNISERSVRNYCENNRIDKAFLKGKTWYIPSNALKPSRRGTSILLEVLKDEKGKKYAGGIYHKTQIELTYNSNHIEGSKLTHEETRYIYETNTIGIGNKAISVNDIIETVNHFRCIDYIIDSAEKKLSETMIKEIHRILKSSSVDQYKYSFKVGEYKTYPNEVGGRETTLPSDVGYKMKELLLSYNSKKKITLFDIIDFNVEFERIHPFQDGNGRVGRLIMFKECLRNNITPFIITDEDKTNYYRGINEWGKINEYLLDTILTAQDIYKSYLNYFQIPLK